MTGPRSGRLPCTWAALIAADDQVTKKKDKTYTVCIHGLDKTQATALQNNYPGATVTEE